MDEETKPVTPVLDLDNIRFDMSGAWPHEDLVNITGTFALSRRAHGRRKHLNPKGPGPSVETQVKNDVLGNIWLAVFGELSPRVSALLSFARDLATDAEHIARLTEFEQELHALMKKPRIR